MSDEQLAIADALVWAAAQHVCPMVAEAARQPGNRTQRSQDAGAADLVSKAAYGLFARLLTAVTNATPTARRSLPDAKIAAGGGACCDAAPHSRAGESADGAASSPVAHAAQGPHTTADRVPPRDPVLDVAQQPSTEHAVKKPRICPHGGPVTMTHQHSQPDPHASPSPTCMWGSQECGRTCEHGSQGCNGSEVPVKPGPGDAWVTRGPFGRGVSVHTVSSYGVVRERAFENAGQLAAALVEWMEAADEELRGSFRDFRVVGKATIWLTTWQHWRAQGQAGYLMCPACGRFYAGERGLRAHQQDKHADTYEEAKAVVDSAKLQIMPLAAPQSWPGAHPHQGAPALKQACVSSTVLLPAFVAARDGHLETLKKLVAEGFDVMTLDEHGSNALLWAAGGGHLHVCKYLVEECGVPVDISQLASSSSTRKHRRRRNALHWAARHGHLAVCRWLVEEHGMDVNSTTLDGTSAFHWAVWQGHLDLCKWLVYQAAADFTHINAYGCNASQWAAQTDNLDMCRWLSAIGLDWKVINRNGHSALHKAANKGQRRVCEWLLNEECLGLKHLAADQQGNTPARMAAAEGFRALAEALQAAEDVLRSGEVLPSGPFKWGGEEEGGAAARAAPRVQRGSTTFCRVAAVRAAKLNQDAPDAAEDLLQASAAGGLSSSSAESPLVSMVLPVHNAAPFLDECLRGIINQTHRPLELSICDNASTDGSADVIAKWAPRLRAAGVQVVLVTTTADEPKGCGYARNRAIRASSGAFICSADADDIMLPRRVEAQLALARAHPRALVGCRFCREPHDATWHYSLWANAMSQRQLRLQQFRECTVAQPTWFYARSTWERAGPFPDLPEPGLDPPSAERALADDLRFFYSHLRQGGSVRRVDEVLVVYRHHGGQLSHSTPRSLITAVKVRALEAMVLKDWASFTVWGAGRDGKAFAAALSPASRRKISAFADVDPNKCGARFESACGRLSVPIVHFSEAKAPIICCVALGRTGGAFEANLASLNLVEGRDYWCFA